jgi:hypothetical protein
MKIEATLSTSINSFVKRACKHRLPAASGVYPVVTITQLLPFHLVPIPNKVLLV